MTARFYLSFFFLPCAFTTFSQPGTLDPGFGVPTHITTDLGSWEHDIARSVAIQPDGKIILAGLVYDYDYSWAATMRYLPDGTRDSTFDLDGKALIGLNGGARARDVVVQFDGKILIAGSDNSNFTSDETDCMLARFNADGSEDNSFGSSGILLINLNPLVTDESNGFTSVSLQTDGKIVGVGYSSYYDSKFTIARFNSDGSLDPSFDGDGKLWIDFNGFGGMANTSIIQPDERIIVGGTTWSGTDNELALIRLLAEGSPDSTFGFNGKVTSGFPGIDAELTCAALQPDGKIVVGGVHGSYDGAKLLAGRYTADGTPDSSFGVNGFWIFDFPGGYEGVESLQIQADGKIVLAGHVTQDFSPYNSDFLVARIDQAGTVDSTFDQDGFIRYDFMGFHDDAYAAAIEADGKVIIAGSAEVGEYGVFGWIRVDTDGSLSAFPPDGKVEVSFGQNSEDYLFDALVQPDDKIIEVGYSDLDMFGECIAILRLMPDGSLDTSFGSCGKVTYSFSAIYARTTAGALTQDGKIIAAGFIDYDTTIILRLLPDGSLDPAFGSNGIVKHGYGEIKNEVRDLVLDGNGKIVIGVEHSTSFSSKIIIARFNPDGSVDSSFSFDGQTDLDFSSSSCCDEVYGLAVQPDNKILAAGSGDPSGNSDFLLARLNQDGTLDTGFDFDGKVITNFTGYSSDFAYAVGVQADGKIICSGKTNDAIGLTRFLSDGSPDNGFGIGGELLTYIPGAQISSFAMMLLPDGNIVVGGTHETSPDIPFLIVKYHADGTVDETFGTQGFTGTNFSDSNWEEIHSLGLQSDGSIIAAGYVYNNGINFATAKFLNDISLGGSSQYEKTTMSVCPNPTSGLVRVEADGLAGELKFYSVTGQQLFHYTDNRHEDLNKQLDLSALPPGMYFITLTSGNEVYTAKIQLIR